MIHWATSQSISLVEEEDGNGFVGNTLIKCNIDSFTNIPSGIRSGKYDFCKRGISLKCASHCDALCILTSLAIIGHW